MSASPGTGHLRRLPSVSGDPRPPDPQAAGGKAPRSIGNAALAEPAHATSTRRGPGADVEGGSPRGHRPGSEQNADPGAHAADDDHDARRVRAIPGPASFSETLVATVGQAAAALAVAPPPGTAAECLAEVEELLAARDRLTAAVAARVAVVHAADVAKEAGHASTVSWLRTSGRMNGSTSARLVRTAEQLTRLPQVAARFADGSLSEGQACAIAAATQHLTAEQVAVAEPILLELAEGARVEELAQAGRSLREIFDQGTAEREARAEEGQRSLLVWPTQTGGLEGRFRLPREAAARLRTWLDTYAVPRAESDDRPLHVRNADAFITLLEQRVSTELVVLVNAESLPDDPVPAIAPRPGAGDSGPETVPGSGPETAGSVPDGGHGETRRADACSRCGHAPNRALPGFLPATGHLLPVADVHRLARTSTLARLVIDAEAQVVDMGRKVRLATPAQRRAVLARYATCWVEGCPIPATLCQIDHADGWADGGATDLTNLGPACAFHNRDRHRRPERYRRRRTGEDRWAFTYTNPLFPRRVRPQRPGAAPAGRNGHPDARCHDPDRRNSGNSGSGPPSGGFPRSPAREGPEDSVMGMKHQP